MSFLLRPRDYDYFQPEAYIAATDKYIEKDSSINDDIDMMRLSATSALMDRNDVIIVSTVSCIYGLGNPDDYKNLSIHIDMNVPMSREAVTVGKQMIRRWPMVVRPSPSSTRGWRSAGRGTTR